jgi:hypothetical protein
LAFDPSSRNAHPVMQNMRGRSTASISLRKRVGCLTGVMDQPKPWRLSLR